MPTSSQEAAATRRMTLRGAVLAAWTILFALLVPPPGWAAEGALEIPSPLPLPLPGVNLFVFPERKPIYCTQAAERFPFGDSVDSTHPLPTVGDTIKLTAQPSAD